MEAGLSEIARFLALRPPFGGLAPEELGELVADTQLEFYTGGEVILSEDGGPVTFLRVIHSGAVDIVHDGRLLDILGPGDAFGHAAMLAGLPPGFEARAAEDTLCYRIPVDVARPLLDRARRRELQSGRTDVNYQPVVKLTRAATVTCKPSENIGFVAERLPELMLELHHSSVPALELAPVLSALVDALTRRALELVSSAAAAPEGVVWVSLGSQARRELTPASTRRGAVIHDAELPPS